MLITRPVKAVALVAASALLLAGCGGQSGNAGSTPSAAATPKTITITDNTGEKTVPSPPKSVVALDNRTFQTLYDWNIKLAAAPIDLIPDTIGYSKDTTIPNIGTHNEPKLELIVAAQPDIVISGQRFTAKDADIAKLVPNVPVVNLDPRKDQPFDSELKRQITVMGEIFAKQAEAKKLNDDFDAAIARVNKAYNKDQTVMAVSVAGGNINYLAPTVGRTLGPVFDFANLTPALKVDGTDNHKGDDISVEAIAQSNPTWILVMDRDAAVGEGEVKPAADVIVASEPLKNVTAVKEGNVIVMPADTYTNESIQTYTKFLNDFADALEKKK